MVSYNEIITEYSASLSDQVLIVFAASLIAIGLFSMFFLMLLNNKIKIGFWSGLGLTAAGAGIVVAFQYYTGLIDWVILGLTGISVYAALFVYGMIAMVAVVIWNLIATRGKTAVR